MSWPVDTFIRLSPLSTIGAPTAMSMASMILMTSPRASSRFLPSSVLTSVAISSMRSMSLGRHVNRISVRFWMGMLAQPG